MPIKRQVRLRFDEDFEKYLQRHFPDIVDYRLISEALDARGANRGKPPHVNYIFEGVRRGEKFSVYEEVFSKLGPLKQKPIIVGAGPAGLFCALRLAEYGVPSILIERGERAHKRMKSIARFWRYGEFDPENNVCFGEGGAGLFSDGKLITRIKSPHVSYVMKRMVDFGAPPETAYVSNPHLGSNKIRLLINKISDYLTSQGCEIHYNTKVSELLYEDSPQKVVGVQTSDGRVMHSSHVVLATGHSAEDIYRHLESRNVAMKAKDFAVGVRVEHPRRFIDQLQYGAFAGADLGAARYRLSYHDPTSERGTYSFCMCPGGYVLSSGTDSDGIVVNGMSNYARNSPWSNAALVVSVKAGHDFKTTQVLEGLEFQKQIEKKAYLYSAERASGKELPSQGLKDFLDGGTKERTLPKSSTPSGTVWSSLREILPEQVSGQIAFALQEFDYKMKGFVSDQALLMAPETRTSAPVTITRDLEGLFSSNHVGLYPCGEGAGHAGGITSAAVDGVKVAMSILKSEKDLEF